MYQSKFFSKTTKNISQDEVSLNAQLLIRGGFVDRLMAGVYSLLPLGWRVLVKIENIIREEMNEIGGQELFLPALQPKENWKKTGRWEELDILFKLKTDKKELALGPTHEEILTPLAKKNINSYKDLPQAVYQFQNKFRNEKRAKSGLLRGREFIMKDLYSFHISEEDLENYYKKVQGAYERIFKKCGIGEDTFLTYASGGTFAKYSHEYQTLTQAGEDTIYICDKCKVAINEEIIENQQNKCPECGNEELRAEKAVEVGNIFKLKDKFSTPFDLFFLDQEGKRKPVLMGCYGIGLQRLMGTIVEIKNDQAGIIWPGCVAPFEVHLIEIGSSNPEVSKSAEELYAIFQKEKIEVLYDDRKDKKPGEKFADCDLMGIPLRIIISEKTVQEKKYEIKRRDEKEGKMVSKEELLKILT